MHIHIIGIGGSGASSLAQIAINCGFSVSGCDINVGSRAVESLRGLGVEILQGHDPCHVDAADIVAASPAVTTGRVLIEEVEHARRQKKLLTWQQFLGEQILRGKRVACIAGTHGKTTTTALVGELLAAAGLDPTVMLGGYVDKWAGNARIGRGEPYVCEADEFNYNFISYRPTVLLLNNVEYEHPEYFKSETEYFDAFTDFVTTMPDGGTLIVNLDDPGACSVQVRCRHFIEAHRVRVLTYSASSRRLDADQRCTVVETQPNGMRLKLDGLVDTDIFQTGLIGKHNVSNILAAATVASQFAPLDSRVIGRALGSFTGARRRLQLIANTGSYRIYDDYGHHPTEIGATLNALREHNPHEHIIAVIEPHMVSRINLFSEQYVEAVRPADSVVFTKVYFGREQGLDEPNIVRVAEAIGRDKAQVFHDFEMTVDAIVRLKAEHGIVVVFGAGNSPELTKTIVQSFS